jgi:VanZ family protein
MERSPHLQSDIVVNSLKENLQRSIWLGRLARYGPLVLWIGVIFYFSSSFGSFNQTSRFIGPLLEFLFPAASPELLAVYHGYIRKFSHFAAYAVLGIVSAAAFATSSRTILRRYWFIASLIVVLLIATLDEINQSYSTLRTASIYDVLIDLFGGLTALFLMYFVWNRRRPVTR